MLLLRSSIFLAVVASLVKAELVVQDGKFTLVDSVGIAAASSQFTSSSPSPLAPATLTSGNTLKLTFTVLDGTVPVLPQQAMISWQATSEGEKGQSGRDHLTVLKVRKGGKGKWELDLSRAPPTLLSISKGPISATLLIGQPVLAKALAIPLGTFTFDSSLVVPYPYPAASALPKAWEVERYSKMPELQHTFRTAEKLVKSPVAIVGLLFVLSPWVVFVSIVSYLKPSFSSPTINIASFLLCIVSFESLIVTYWTSLTLIPTLPYFALLAVLTALTGKRALGDVRSRRIAREAKVGKTE